MEMTPDQQTALKLLNKYDPQPSYELAERLLEGVTKIEAEGWFNHPCTQSLIASLDGDIAGIVSALIGGAYSHSESVDATAQDHAKIRGMAQAIEDVIERIREIRATKIEDANKDESQGL